MATANADYFDSWIRNEFIEINTQLEHQYFAQSDRHCVANIGTELKQQLVSQGADHIELLLEEGNTDEGYESGFNLLGNVGFFMAACRRHEIVTESSLDYPHATVSALAMQLGASLGMVPRFASSHLETHNQAIDGRYKSFTLLDDEALFIERNTNGVIAYIRASQALLQILPLGISHPLSYELLANAKTALERVVTSNAILFKELDVDRFFYSIRPYYKTHHVGKHEYRGANAGDFAGINVIDLLLGLCRANDPYYSQILVDKFLYMRPEDQAILRECMRQTSLLDQFMMARKASVNKPWFKKNLGMFLEVCDAHGRAARQHHEVLVEKFIRRPAASDDSTNKPGLTASGPPLNALLKSLKHLRDLRCAANEADIGSRYSDIQRLKECQQ